MKLLNRFKNTKHLDLITEYNTEFLKAELGNGLVVTQAQFNKELQIEINHWLYAKITEKDLLFIKNEIPRLKKYNENNDLKII